MAAVLVLVGCERPVEIRQYDVPKPPHQMLGAIVFRSEEAWFFKVTGPREGLSHEAENFQKFVQSIRFEGASSDGPTWKLPDGWREAGGSKMRYMTIKFQAGDEECELAVSHLPMRGAETEYLLDNVNRWRGQIQLYPLLGEDLVKATQTVPLEGNLTATVIQWVGTLEPKSPNAKPMDMGMGNEMLAGPRPKPAPPRAPTTDLKFQLPDGWSAAEQNQFSKLAFEVRDEGQLVKITVTDLAAAGNTLLENINRWRGIMKLPPVKETELPQLLRSIQMGDVAGQYVEITSPSDLPKPQAILGVVAYRGDLAWFVKLQGDASLASREKARFEQFVQSLQF